MRSFQYVKAVAVRVHPSPLSSHGQLVVGGRIVIFVAAQQLACGAKHDTSTYHGGSHTPAQLRRERRWSAAGFTRRAAVYAVESPADMARTRPAGGGDGTSAVPCRPLHLRSVSAARTVARLVGRPSSPAPTGAAPAQGTQLRIGLRRAGGPEPK